MARQMITEAPTSPRDTRRMTPRLTKVSTKESRTRDATAATVSMRLDVGSASVVGDECSWWAAGEGVEEHAEREREQALGDPLCEAGGSLGEVVFEAHLAFEVGDRRLDHEPDAGQPLLAGEVGGGCVCGRGEDRDVLQSKRLARIRVPTGPCRRSACSRGGRSSAHAPARTPSRWRRRASSRPARPCDRSMSTRRIAPHELALGGAVAVGGVPANSLRRRAARRSWRRRSACRRRSAPVPRRPARRPAAARPRSRASTGAAGGCTATGQGRCGNQPGSDLGDQTEELAIGGHARSPPAPPPSATSSASVIFPLGPGRGIASSSANTYAATTRVSSEAVISCSNHEGTGLEALSSSPYRVPAHELQTHIKPLGDQWQAHSGWSLR